jgi:hypothetical protein
MRKDLKVEVKNAMAISYYKDKISFEEKSKEQAI